MPPHLVPSMQKAKADGPDCGTARVPASLAEDSDGSGRPRRAVLPYWGKHQRSRGITLEWQRPYQCAAHELSPGSLLGSRRTSTATRSASRLLRAMSVPLTLYAVGSPTGLRRTGTTHAPGTKPTSSSRRLGSPVADRLVTRQVDPRQASESLRWSWLLRRGLLKPQTPFARSASSFRALAVGCSA